MATHGTAYPLVPTEPKLYTNHALLPNVTPRQILRIEQLFAVTRIGGEQR